MFYWQWLFWSLFIQDYCRAQPGNYNTRLKLLEILKMFHDATAHKSFPNTNSVKSVGLAYYNPTSQSHANMDIHCIRPASHGGNMKSLRPTLSTQNQGSNKRSFRPALSAQNDGNELMMCRVSDRLFDPLQVTEILVQL